MCSGPKGSQSLRILPFSILSEVEVVELNIQAALGRRWRLGWGWGAAKGGMGVYGGMGPELPGASLG